jgi:hypothetical protein
LNSPTFLPLNVLEKVILVEQFYSQYIVIGIQAVNAEGSEMKHVRSIVIKVEDGRAQFNGRNAGKFELHNSGGSSRIILIQVLTLDSH